MIAPVAAFVAGEISPQVAVSRMLLSGMEAAAIVQACAPVPALAALVAGRSAALDGLAQALRRSGSHDAMGSVAAIAGFFDRVAAHSPEAGVALYSLGDAAILAAATAEIVDWLAAERLLAPGAAVLDVGCGIGRVTAALAPRCATVLGVDVSPRMVAEARQRHPGLSFAVTDGAGLPPGRWDLVLLVDTMPYIVAAGLAEQVVAHAAAALRPGGALAVLNLSYGRAPGQDAADAARWATLYSWHLAATRPFRLWDGAAWVFRALTES